MEKDFDCRHHLTHQLLDREKLEKTTATHFLLVPMRLHDFLRVAHLNIYYAIYPSKTKMIQNKMVQNHLVSFDRMCQLPWLHLQLENQWHSRAANLDMRSLEQGFHFPQDGPDQDLSTVDFGLHECCL